MHKFKHGELRSGSKSGPQVKNRKQAIAIMMSEKRNAGSNPEYQSKAPKSMMPSDNLGNIKTPGIGKLKKTRKLRMLRPKLPMFHGEVK